MKKISNVESWDRVVFVNDSSNISEIKYNVFERVMQIKFISGGLYEYSQVGRDTLGYLISAQSIGKAFAGMRGRLEEKGARRVGS